MLKKIIYLFVIALLVINSMVSFAAEKASGIDVYENKFINVESSPLLSVISPDSRHVAYVAQSGDRQFVVVDGKEGKHYDGIGPNIVFSPDSRHIVYGAQAGNKQVAVVDGKEGNPYDVIGTNFVFSPDSKRLIYSARKGNKIFAVIDGQE